MVVAGGGGDGGRGFKNTSRARMWGNIIHMSEYHYNTLI